MGPLVDTVYAHVFAWQRALAEAGLPIDGWRIHRRSGMSGGLFTRAVAREAGRPLSDDEAESIQRRHGLLHTESCCPNVARYRELSTCWPSCAPRASRMGSRLRVAGPRSTPRWMRLVSQTTPGRDHRARRGRDRDPGWRRLARGEAPAGSLGAGHPQPPLAGDRTAGEWPLDGPAQMRYLEAILGILRSAGFSVDDAAHAFWLIHSYVHGHTSCRRPTSRAVGRRRRPRWPVPDSSPTSEATTRISRSHRALPRLRIQLRWRVRLRSRAYPDRAGAQDEAGPRVN